MEIKDRCLKELHLEVANKTLSCEEICQYYLKRIEKYKGLNSILCLNNKAIEEARNFDNSQRVLPLQGCFVLIKDNIDLRGFPTTAGSSVLKENVVDEDAPFIRELKEKGAIILGKTNMVEFANFLTQGMPAGFSSLGGQVINAYNSEASTSGSSSGSAVAMSADLCSFALGTDTSFSVVGCASCNGVVGFKPTMGRISQEGVLPITSQFDSIGFFTKNLDDLEFIYEAMFNETFSDVELNKLFKINTYHRDAVAEKQLAFYNHVIEELKNDDFEIMEVDEESPSNLKTYMLLDFAEALDHYFLKHHSKFSALKIKEEYDKHQEYQPYGISYLAESIRLREERDYLDKKSSILEDINNIKEQVLYELDGADACMMSGSTCVMNYIGLPSISIPIAMGEDGVPCNMVIYGTNDLSLLKMAMIIEKKGQMVTRPNLDKYE